MRRPRPPALAGENPRPPRYRLLAAAAKLPQRDAEQPHAIFERDCPGCGRAVLFTQVELPSGPEYLIENHDCRSGAD